MVDERDLAGLLEDRPELADAVSAALDVDEEHDGWEFDDVPVGTGLFGEIVGEGIVEDAGEGYRVADPHAVRNALARRDAAGEADAEATGDPGATSDTGGGSTDTTGSGSVAGFDPDDAPLPAFPASVDGRGIAVAFVVAVAFVLARVIPYGQVFRDGTVVLSGNDPYFYRYWVEQTLARSSSPVALGALVDANGVISGAGGEPLYVTTVWWASTLLGGTAEAAATVLAWYPVIAALCIGAITYWIGAGVLDDRRVGVAAAALLAVLPAHAMRTSVGFADHHAFDYAWLLATVAALAWLVAADERSGTALRRGAVALGVAVAGLTMSWNGAPLMLLVVAASLAASVPLDVAYGRSPRATTAPVVAGLAVAGVLSLFAHLVLTWQSPAVAAVPALLAVGAATLVGVGELAEQRGLSARRFALAELAVPVVGLVVAAVAIEGAFGRLVSGVTFLLGTEGIGETGSAFAPDDLFGLELFGLAIVVALPVMCWGAFRTLQGDRRWLVLSVSAWYFFVLSVIQVRFVGQFAPFVALFAATGLVRWAARYDLTPAPVALRDGATATDGGGGSGAEPDATGLPPDAAWFDRSAVTWQSGLAVAVLVVALVATSAAFLPAKTTASAVPDRNYRTATWMADYADERGWTYPDSYVLSRWSQNRMFNYYVSGESESYGYARDTYPEFISSVRGESSYERLRDRVGFVVLEPLPRRANTMQERLYYTYGSRWADQGYEAVSHYRAVYTSSDQATKVFVLVPGARIDGQVAANTTVELRTDVEIPNDSFTYRTRVTADANGSYQATVPYPGEYELQWGNRTTTVTVPESAVENGTGVRVGS